jgi:hypothetical protein
MPMIGRWKSAKRESKSYHLAVHNFGAKNLEKGQSHPQRVPLSKTISFVHVTETTSSVVTPPPLISKYIGIHTTSAPEDSIF